MKTLDRYILSNFLFSTGLWLLVFMVLRTVADLFINMDEFAERGLPFLGLLQVIASYYGHQSLVYFTELGGVIIVASATFTLAMMNRTNELTAILASGVSLRRVILPVVLCSIVISGLIVVDRELLIPRVKHKLVRDRDNVLGRNVLAVRTVTDGTNAVWHGAEFRPDELVMMSPTVVLRGHDLEQVGCIVARSAVPVRVDGRPGWRFAGGLLAGGGHGIKPWRDTPRWDAIHTRIDPNHLLSLQAKGAKDGASPVDATADVAANPDPDARGTPAAGTGERACRLRIRAERFIPDPADPKDPNEPRTGALERPRFTFRSPNGQIMGIFVADRAQWRLEPDGPEGHWRLEGGYLFYPSDLSVDDLVLRQSRRWLDYMSTSEITRLLRLDRVSDRASAVLTKHVRFTEPISNLIMLLLGLPFILSRERNVKASASFCLLTVGTFYAFIYICRQMGLPPALAAWMPILLFGPIAVVMVDSIKT